MSRGITILGSTGSVGQTTLKVIRHMPEAFHVVGLAAGRRVDILMEEIREFSPRVVSVVSEEDARTVSKAFPGLDIHYGPHGALAVAEADGADTVVAAIVGSDGLAPTFKAVKRGKRVALANKESLVMAGRLVMEAARRSGAEILPVDSEHCAVFQCMRGESPKHIRRLVLTASGGALRDVPLDEVESAPVDKVLAHPTWKMGRKITVDSATMMNKGLEIIEAHYLFGVPVDNISVLMHRESIVHSMVEFVDGSMVAQLADADMILPVQYALTYPARRNGPMPFLKLADLETLTFSSPEPERYPCLDLARQAAKTSEAHMITMNAANEEVVAAFLQGRIPFGSIHTTIRKVMDATVQATPGSLEQVLALNASGRSMARKFLSSMEHNP
jgi:1-deoxy-D-xylulose-5-phosphate reductoisomerase